MNRVAIDLKSSFPVRAEGDRIECASCGVEKMKAVVAYGLVKQLEEKVAGLVLECQALRSMLAVNQFLASVEVVSLSGDTGSEGGGSNPDLSQLQPQPQLQQPPPSSAEELYGPMEFEFALIAMKSLPSLRDCVYVDKLFGTFVTQSQCKDWEEIRKLNFRTMYLRAKVLDACSVLDRHAVVESIVLFLHRNRSHIMHRDSAFLDNARNPKPVAWIPPGEVSIPKEAQKFRESLMSIKAFQDASVQPMIDEFLAVFWTPVSKRKGKDRLHRIMILGKQLEKLCDTIEDSYKVNILIEVIREGNRKQWDNLFEGMEME
ncbi:hypothetical protein BDR26DRAFT_852432 [Obelidium mucronatum]|nr:hypothetical protein BDR26DRAFT_852432 [Obelidium mucronatum]